MGPADAARSANEVGDTASARVGYSPRQLEPPLADAIRRGLRRGQARIVDVDEEGCEGAPTDVCVRDAARAQGLTHIVLPERRDLGPDVRLHLYLTNTETGEEASRLTADCEICGEAELEAMAEDLAGQLSREFGRLGSSMSRLEVAGRPVGATLYIDDEPVGLLPWSGQVAAGSHLLRVEHPDFKTRQRTLEVAAQTDAIVSMSLDPVAPAEVPRAPRPDLSASEFRPITRAAIGLAVGGSVLLAGGITLVVLDGENQCRRGETPDDGGFCKDMFTSAELGAALIAVGAAATGAGLAWLGLRWGTSRRVRASASVGSIVLSGQF